VTNAPEIIVKMKRGKIVTHYKCRNLFMSDDAPELLLGDQ
jgi:hypothetical protein